MSFIETHLCKLRVTLRSRVPRVPGMKRTVRDGNLFSSGRGSFLVLSAAVYAAGSEVHYGVSVNVLTLARLRGA